MNIKNYTSKVPIEKSITQICQMLAEIGAKNVNMKYENKMVTAVTFLIDYRNNTLAFKLPVKFEAVEKVLREEVKRPREDTFERIRKQSGMTAWKILKDWVEIQCTMILLEQAELAEVFLPYLYDAKADKTLFQKVESGDIKLLS